MPIRRARWGLALAAIIALTLLACSAVERPFTSWRLASSPSPSVTVTPAPPSRPAPSLTAQPGPTQRVFSATPPASQPTLDVVRPCGFVPGVSTPATMPPEVLAADTPTPLPSPTLPANTAVDQAVIDRQLKIYRQLWDTVNTEYVYRDFNGRDWEAIGAKYEALVKQGLTDADFYRAMDLMIAELGDDHSRFDSPEAVQLDDQIYQGHTDYVGVGIRWNALPQAGLGYIIYVYADSPAAKAGLRSHDNIVAVDGKGLFDSNGKYTDAIRGPAGTSVTLTIKRPGDKTFDVTMTRRRINSPLPIDFCLIPATRLAYLFLPGLDDSTVPAQVRSALQALTAGGPLAGLVLDNRQNLGGAEPVLEEILGFFLDGIQGHFVSHQDERPLIVARENIGNSQTVPMVVLISPNTASFGEVMSGVLQNSGRARLAGQRTRGVVEILYGYDFNDGSRAWIAQETFQPINLPNGVWSKRGVEPDVAVPSRWDLFTEATDPGLAVAVQLLRASNR